MTAISIGDTSEARDVQILQLMTTESAWKGKSIDRQSSSSRLTDLDLCKVQSF